MTLPLRRTRSRTSDIAIQCAYEAAKLMATSLRPRERLPEVLSLLADFLELRDAAIALQGQAGEPELISMHAARQGAARRWAELLDAALERTQSTRMPWIVESEWGEPTLDGVVDEYENGALDASFVAVPIKDGGRVIGVLGIERAHGPGDQACFCFDSDVRLLTVIAHTIAQATGVAEDRSTETQTGEASPPRVHPARVSMPTPRANVQPALVRVLSPTKSSPSCGRGASSVSGSHPRWRATLERAGVAARSSSTVLLRGESGTGKEVLARYIHEMAPRANRSFVSVNCAALAESVLESELFGHEKGAFTGAVTQRKGRFELADGGTLFLDEIGEMSGAFQARLLRVLQLGEFERVGGMRTLKVDVRVLAATHRNLEQEVRSGRFRSDLYYRVSVVPLSLPALRERASDIPELAVAFLSRFNDSNGTRLSFEPSALAALQRYSFPGNVRELENGVRRAASLAQSPRLTASDFEWLQEDTPLTLALQNAHSQPAPASTASPGTPASHAAPGTQPRETQLRKPGDDESRERLIDALERAGWVQAKAARLLGLTPRQIAYALQKHGIQVRKF